MKYLKILLISFLSIFILSFVTLERNFVSANDVYAGKYENHEEHGDNKEGAYKEIGGMVGWGTVMSMGAAGLIFPIRKSAKWILKNYPASKSLFISISKFFGKYHLFIGTAAITLGIFHGVTMYLSEGELETGGVIGLGALILMMIAGVFGAALFKNKKVKSLRSLHAILIAFAILIVFIHIVTS